MRRSEVLVTRQALHPTLRVQLPVARLMPHYLDKRRSMKGVTAAAVAEVHATGASRSRESTPSIIGAIGLTKRKAHREAHRETARKRAGR